MLMMTISNASGWKLYSFNGEIARKLPGIKEENHEEIYRQRPVQCGGR